MAAPDMEVIKEIPGYKVILKAVLKSQIQQLVEQLASHTEEETVVLTASLSDGTLSHLGSASGKSFLEDHEEMKSQFLGFCLKRHHQKSQEKALRHLEMQSPGFQDPTVMGYSPHPSQRGQIGTSRTSKVGRHEPYRRRRGQGPRQTSGMGLPATDQSQTDSVTGISGTPDNSAIKTESESIENESSNQSLIETGADSNVHDSGHLQQANSESTDLNTVDSVTEPLADFAGDGSNTDQSNELDSGAICDNSINVKQEEGLDSDLELQITGMEPARSTVSQDNWGGNMSMSDVSMDMTYDPIGATGSSLDIQAGQQGYRSHYIPETTDNGAFFRQRFMLEQQSQAAESQAQLSVSPLGSQGRLSLDKASFQCNICGKPFKEQKYLNRHMSVHTGDKPFQCQYCSFKCNRKDNLKTHVFVKHMQQ